MLGWLVASTISIVAEKILLVDSFMVDGYKRVQIETNRRLLLLSATVVITMQRDAIRDLCIGSLFPSQLIQRLES